MVADADSLHARAVGTCRDRLVDSDLGRLQRHSGTLAIDGTTRRSGPCAPDDLPTGLHPRAPDRYLHFRPARCAILPPTTRCPRRAISSGSSLPLLAT